MVSMVTSEQCTASSAIETECSVLSGYSENGPSDARSGGGVQRISEQPGMIIRVVQMRCEVYSSFGSVQCILNQSITHELPSILLRWEFVRVLRFALDPEARSN